MAKDGRKARYNVISMRMTDEEMANVQELMAKTNKNASTLMRHAFNLLMMEWFDHADAGQQGGVR